MLPIDLPRTSGIYKIYFLDSNLFYIGSSINVHTRCREHLKHLRQGKHHNIHLQRAFAIHGEDVLHYEVVELVERKEDLIGREQYYLDTLKPHYNISPTARSALGVKARPETKAMRSAAHKGKTPWNKGKKASDETRAKLSASHKGQIPTMKGRKHTPESLAKISVSVKAGLKGIKRKPASEEERQRLQGMGFRAGQIPWNKGINLDGPSKRKGVPLSPESREQMFDKNLEYRLSRTPEQKARTLAKWHATKAANLAEEVARWEDDTPAS